MGLDWWLDETVAEGKSTPVPLTGQLVVFFASCWVLVYF